MFANHGPRRHEGTEDLSIWTPSPQQMFGSISPGDHCDEDHRDSGHGSIGRRQRGAIDDENAHERTGRRQLQPKLFTQRIEQARVIGSAGELRSLSRSVTQLETVVTVQAGSINDDSIDAGHATHVHNITGKLAHRNAACADANL